MNLLMWPAIIWLLVCYLVFLEGKKEQEKEKREEDKNEVL